MVDLGWLTAETRALEKASRRIKQAAAQLHDEQERQVAQLWLTGACGFRESDVLAFVRLHISRGLQVHITASQPVRAQTKEQDHGKDV